MTDEEAIQITAAVSRLGMAKGQLLLNATDADRRVELADEYVAAYTDLRSIVEGITNG